MIKMNFWSFSLQIYAKPGVGPACIALQDGLGLDVNLLLYCCWHGRENRALSEKDIHRAIAASEGWQREVVQPLRAVRRRLKAGVAPVSAAECEALPAPAAGRRPAIEANLALYLKVMGRDPARASELQTLSVASL